PAAAPRTAPPASPSTAAAPAPPSDATTATLKGAAARVVANMEASLHVPTATSVRAVPAKLLEDNRTVINRHLARTRGGKISFTHLIGFALVRAVRDFPEMNHSFAMVDGKPTLVTPDQIGLGLAIDLVKSNGDRQLVVAAVKDAGSLDFTGFWSAYEDVVRRARNGKLTTDDFSGVTISLTNPGGFGTVHSVPRLTEGQGAIIGVGAMEYPAEFQGASKETIARLGVSKIITITSTYDHRVIQGAQSGEFLRRMHQLLLGEDGFYDDVFRSLSIPYEPIRWVEDNQIVHDDDLGKQARIQKLIHAYRVRGHLIADTNPLYDDVKTHPDLDVLTYGLTLWDLDREWAIGDFAKSTGKKVMQLRDVLGVLRDAYCRSVGIEYMHLQDPDQRDWLQENLERKHERPDREHQLHVLERLGAAEAFEAFLQTKYVGQKRFSLEGGETLIPMLDEILQGAAEDQLDEVVIGMPHRGRLNVLANIVGKSYGQIFKEFDGYVDPDSAHGSGDVKYHLGAEGTFTARGGEQVKVSLASNPSHLEAVDPVMEGVVRAKQDILDKGVDGFTVLPLMLHGDAAFAGQGVVAEVLNLSQLRGYRTGGTVHVVVNNQVGFTTDASEARSSVYATDVARMIQAPIFHVNGDDPDACVRVARLAFEFRQMFRKDVVIDMVCYRRRGHNEGDDPSMTQPLMYKVIEAKRSTRHLYTEALVGRGDITVEEAENALASYRAKLEQAFQETREDAQPAEDDAWSNTQSLPILPNPDVTTAIPMEVVKRIVASQLDLPAGFEPHPRVKSNVLERRAAMVDTDSIDWGMGETLAIGALLLDGHPVRMAGQDTRRGTFVQRHAALIDHRTGEAYVPLRNLAEGQAPFMIYDSLLSEYAAMGFEYGYSVARPNAFVAWEAQFGDFADGAQTIVDEFLSSGEAKWGQRSGVVLLLPHGYEGQGPDHSSARVERYLQLCAEDNMVVAMPSTPASYFHLLRRHVRGAVQKPMVVFTPKSLLRLKAAVSATADFTDGAFQPVLDDATVGDPAGVTRVILCAGKVYYDLAKEREKNPASTVAIARVERLYPHPLGEITATLERYPNAHDVVWVQEEPANMGAWPTLALALPEVLPAGRALRRVSRRAAASPAVGSAKAHEVEQNALVAAALS
ncbi:MAG TPA: multifunctional oxoglutarate decarboxylase/oxoglutarate dehydrogenase thiamine pyrophosphate-binding subunit/dihydrolipoyllysine-residue succinyltransferase subunit, partial [Mycobacteriales bacterium]|nr:multifunctional oxoglutarate decarboxylase/oxoglutarate dehydrogenase thiamine pyrophosphate-binding subunit/dihydrolipoyllysine-residue succinyltransferase subunit [Mycobacteriales bacterium]